MNTISTSAVFSRCRLRLISLLLCLTAQLFLLSTMCVAQAQATSPPQGQAPGQYTLRLEVNLVQLSVTVEGRKNSFVSGLGKDDFQVYEDGVAEHIEYFSHEDIPVTAGLVVDHSGSMRAKVPDVVAAALKFAQSSNPQDQMFVVNFNEHVSFGLPGNTPFTDRTSQLQAALSAGSAHGETALYDAIGVALDHLKQGNRDKKVLIVVSDGGDNASKLKLAQVIAMAEKSNALIYAIGIYADEDEDKNPGVLNLLAKDTGGEAFFPKSLDEISPVCERIAHDIRNQYSLAYTSTNKKQDGAYRAIEVKASAPGRGRLSVRTRAGYLVPQSAGRQGDKP